MSSLTLGAEVGKLVAKGESQHVIQQAIYKETHKENLKLVEGILKLPQDAMPQMGRVSHLPSYLRDVANA